jgi:hypothetical protein
MTASPLFPGKHKPTASLSWRWVFFLLNFAASSAGDLRQKTCNSLSLGCISRLRHSRLGAYEVHLPIPWLVVQFAGLAFLSTLPQSVLEELDQAINQTLLPANDVEAALVTMLLQNFADTAFQICHF